MNLRYFIAGNSGCGKSTLASKILEGYAKLYPHQNIYIISAVDSDEAYDKNPKLRNKIQRIDIRDDLSDISTADFSNSIVVFDDWFHEPSPAQASD